MVLHLINALFHFISNVYKVVDCRLLMLVSSTMSDNLYRGFNCLKFLLDEFVILCEMVRLFEEILEVREDAGKFIPAQFSLFMLLLFKVIDSVTHFSHALD